MHYIRLLTLLLLFVATSATAQQSPSVYNKAAIDGKVNSLTALAAAQTGKINSLSGTTATLTSVQATQATTIAANTTAIAAGPATGSITNARLATAPANTFKGNMSTVTAAVSDLSVTDTRTALGVNQVNNTSDAGKPISTATQSAINSVSAIALGGLQSVTAVSAMSTRTEATVRYDNSDWKRVTGSITLDNVLYTSGGTGFYYARQVDYVTPQMFGAKGDSLTDDRTAILAAFNSGRNVVIPKVKGFYRYTGMMVITGVSGLKVSSDGARVLNADKTTLGILFQNSNAIDLSGLQLGFSQSVTANGGNSQHIIQFDNCQKVTLTNMRLFNSPEMGVAFTNCYDIQVLGGTIENTWRDGIYARYCAKVIVRGVRFRSIKDDAISFHDKDNYLTYVTADKTILNGYGYSQSSDAVIEQNDISEAYEGIVSIAGANVTIRNNKVNNVVLAGIAVYNINNADPAGAKDIKIEGNILTNTGVTTMINSVTYANNGQSGPGRAAIFVGSTGTNNQVGMGETKRLAGVTIQGNTVSNGGANLLWTSKVDNLNLGVNTWTNGAPAGGVLGGIPLEVNDGVNFWAAQQKIIDTRVTPVHTYGYQINTVTGYMQDWQVTGYTTGIGNLLNATPITPIADKKIPVALANINSSGSTSFDSFTTAGSAQIAGGAYTGGINAPPIATGAVMNTFAGNDAVGQLAVDYLGNVAMRMKNGIVAGTWSPWTPLADASKTVSGATAQSKSIAITTGDLATMNLPSGDYSLAPAVTNAPTASLNYTLHVTHHEDPAAAGGGTWATWVAIPLVTTNKMYIGGRNGDGTQKTWVTVL